MRTWLFWLLLLLVGTGTDAAAKGPASPFRDLKPDDPELAVIATAVQEGVIAWPGLDFRPDDPANLYEWTAVVAGLMDVFGLEATSKVPPSADVPGDHWAFGQVVKARSVLGPAEGRSFGGDRLLTIERLRQDVQSLFKRLRVPPPSLPAWLGPSARATRRLVARTAVLVLSHSRQHREPMAEPPPGPTVIEGTSATHHSKAPPPCSSKEACARRTGCRSVLPG